MHAFLQRGVDDLRGRQSDALIDYFHAAITGAHGDLLSELSSNPRFKCKGIEPVPRLSGLSDPFRDDPVRAPE